MHGYFADLMNLKGENSTMFSLYLDNKRVHRRRKRREKEFSYTLLNVGIHGIDPISLAFDWVGNNLYWIDGIYGKPVIMISDIGGFTRRKIVTKVLNNPQTVALDPIRG